MTDDFVVVRTRGQSPAELGEIVQQTAAAGEWLVRWTDGTEEAVKPSITMSLQRVRRGSIRYQSLIEPDALATAFDADPGGVAVQLVRESPVPLSATVLREQLGRLGLTAASSAETWTRIKSGLAQHPHIGRRKQPPGYEWHDEAVDPLRELRKRTPSEALGLLVSGKPTPEQIAVLSEIVTDAAARDPVAAWLLPAANLAAPAGAPWPGIFAGARQLAEYPTAATSRVVKQAGIEALGAAVLGSVLAVTREGAVKALGALAMEQMSRVIRLADREVNADPSFGQAPAAEGLVSSLLAQPAVDKLEASDLELFWALTASTAHDGRLDSLEQVTSLAADRWTEDLRRVAALDAVKERTTRLPLTPGRARARVLAALAETDVGVLTDRSWWHGVTVYELAQHRAGPLAVIIRSDHVVQAVVQPLLDETVSAANTRQAAFAVLSLPAAFARLVTPNAAGELLRRVAGHDQMLGGWLRVLGDDDRLDDLQERLRVERERAEAAERQVGETAAQRETALRAAHDAAERAQTASNETYSLGTRQRRQVRLDVLKALAELASEMPGLAGMPAAEASETVAGLVEAYDLDQVGTFDERVVFDASRHRLIAGKADSGLEVIVVRPGYVLVDGDDVVVLNKALVRGP